MSGKTPAPTGSGSEGGSSDGGIQVNANDGSSLTISVSAMVAAVWAGIWGFDWAATHLSGTQLLAAVLVGLFTGTALTGYLFERAFQLAKASPAAHKELKLQQQ
jgi:hypothetical protein